MQELRSTLNQILRINEHLAITKNEDTDEVTITIKPPFSKIGLNKKEWFEITSHVLLYIDLEEKQTNKLLNEYFNLHIKPKYVNIIQRILPSKILPTIVVSILTQRIHEISLERFSHKPLDYEYIDDYLIELQELSLTIPQSYSAVSKYVINRYIDQDEYNVINGVNLIYWIGDTRTINTPFEIYGVQHLWDHYNYKHLHVVESYAHHRLLLLNAIKRTWIAQLEMTAGLREQFTRVNYGYMAPMMLPTYTLSQYQHLAKLNLGTTILPPYSITKIKQMNLNAIESIVIKTFRCLQHQPSLSTIYVTLQQLNQEEMLGNIPLRERLTIKLPARYIDNLPMYPSYSTNVLPRGPAFNPDMVLMNASRQIKSGYPLIVPIQPTTAFCPSSFEVDYQSRGVIPNTVNYVNYLSMLNDITTDQFSIEQILKYTAPNGVSINIEPTTTRIITYVILNKDIDGVDIPHALQNPDDVSSILTLTERKYAPDFHLSDVLLHEIEGFRSVLNLNYQSINVLFMNPSVYPSTINSLLKYNGATIDIYSLQGSQCTYGSMVDSLWSFTLLNSNMLYICITESEYLSDVNAYRLFTSHLSRGKYYSIEFLDFKARNLSRAIGSIIESLQLLTGQNEVKLSFTALILSPYRVGVRVVFSTESLPWITSSYSVIAANDVIPFSRLITPSTIAIDPIKSQIYSQHQIPRNGSQLVMTCQMEDFNDTFGYMSSICRYTTVKSYYNMYNYYEFQGIVDASRIALMDRLRMFRSNTAIKPEQLTIKESSPKAPPQLKLSYFELVTQTDHFLLYLLRKRSGDINNALSDYGSADFINVALTEGEYTMYDIDRIDTADIPGVHFIQGELFWGQPLPYIPNNDVLIYNSIFFVQDQDIDTLAAKVSMMLSSVRDAKNVYFNLPYMSDIIYQNVAHLNIVSIRNNRYYLKLSNYPEVICYTEEEINQILSSFPQNQWHITQMQPTLLDYYFTSRMIQRYASSNEYFNALVLHSCIPLFLCTKL